MGISYHTLQHKKSKSQKIHPADLLVVSQAYGSSSKKLKKIIQAYESKKYDPVHFRVHNYPTYEKDVWGVVKKNTNKKQKKLLHFFFPLKSSIHI